MKKKLMSALIAIIMLLSMIPGAALAENTPGSAGQIGSYFEVNDDTGELPSSNTLSASNTQQEYASGAVKVNKTIAATDKENVFDITLTVETKEAIEQQISTVSKAAVVLVIDISGSMNYCLEYGHSECKNMNSHGGSRIAAANKAAKDFIDAYVKVGDSRKLAIVTFSGYKDKKINGATTNLDWRDVTSANKSDIQNKINYTANGGTNVEAGLILAKNLLNQDAVNGYSKNIILISDGMPTYYVNNNADKTSTSVICQDGNSMGGNGQKCQHDCHENVEDLTTGSGALTDINKFAIYIEGEDSNGIDCTDTDCSLDTTVNNWLSSCGFTTFSADSSDDLADNFESITESINNAQAWQVLDPISSSVVFSQGFTDNAGGNKGDVVSNLNNNIRWNLLKEAINDNETKTTYDCKYQVVLNTLADGYAAGTTYATNGVTYLTYELFKNDVSDGVKKAYFNIPAVEGYEGNFSFRKTDADGNNLAGAKFTMTHKDGNGCQCNGVAGKTWSVTSTSGTGNNVEFNQIPSGHEYTLTETAAPSGYAASDESYNVSVDYGVVTITDDEGNPVDLDNFAVENEEKETINIPVRKTWSDDKNFHSGVKVTLYANGKSTGRTLTLNSDNKWVGVFTDIDRKDANGKEIVYSVRENFDDDNYNTTIIGSAEIGFTIHNIHKNYTIVTVNKVWNDGDDRDGLRPDSVNVQLQRKRENNNDWEKHGNEVILSDENGWTYTWADLETEYGNGYSKGKYSYQVVEVGVPNGYTASGGTATENSETAGYTATITNSYNPAVTSVSVNKAWVGEADHPSSVTVQLKANGVAYGDPVTLSENNWAYTWRNLPAKSNGTAIAYTVAETNVPENYESKVTGNAVDGFTITNTLKTTDITVTKVWEDANDQDGKRPGSVKVQLYADETAYGTPVTLNEGNNWTYTWTGLEVYDDGEEIVYTVDETAVPSGYTKGISGNVTNGFAITNSYTPETISISGSKTWVDGENQDGMRPSSITVKLMNGTTEVASKTVGAADNWAWTFENLPKYENGEEITYTITEDAVEGYTTVYGGNAQDGFTITNTHTPAKTEVTVTKAWNDANNQDGIRPASIQVQLKANGAPVEGKIIPLNAANNWQGKFENLPVKANGNAIAYTVAEIAVPTGYTQTVGEVTGNAEDGYAVTVTNSHTPEVISVSGRKTWKDADDQDGKRPDSIIIKLMNGTTEVARKTVTAADNWAWSFNNLPKYAAGAEINYTIDEVGIPDYSTVINGYDVTNSHPVETVDVKGSKTWVDNDNQDGKRPTQITVRLLKNGTAVDSQTVSEETGWAWSFTDRPKYEAGKEIVYTVAEDKVEGYETEIVGFNITNTHTPETTEVTVAKEWDDSNDQDGIRPDSVSVQLYANGTASGAAVVLNQNNGWTYTWTQLDKFAGGSAISYTVDEVVVPSGYSKTVAGDAVNGFTITNTHIPATVEVSGSKTWNDKNNQDGIRPGSITINLLADGKKVGSQTVTAADKWAWSFTGLPKYEKGQIITYTISEVEVEGYTTAVNGYNVTNSYTPETTEVKGSKTWEDDDNRDGVRPESLTINLYANGQLIDSKPVTAKDGWKWEFTNLPKYDGGKEITYNINEVSITDYTTRFDGYNVTNTHNPGMTSVTVHKVWNDEYDQDGIRPDSVTVQLKKNGEGYGDPITLNEDNQWRHTWENLPKKAAGADIVYTVAEISEVKGYTTTVTGDAASGFTVTNTHTPETTEVKGSKIWDDNNNQDGLRPSSITINLLADGEEIDSVTVEADANNEEAGKNNEWPWSFTNLPKFRDGGTEIVYTITEDAVEGYTTAIDGYNVTNSHTPETINISGSKTWADGENQDGIRPESITVNLLADGKDTGKTAIANAASDWEYAFEDLPKYKGGELIEYTVTEDAVDGYTSEVSDSEVDGFVITNTHTPETTSVSVSKVWDDAYDQDGIRPGSIIIKLFDGKKQVDAKTIKADDNWEYTFTNLPKYRDGKEIVYTVTEEVIAGYTTEITGSADKGYTVTNSYTPQVVSVSGSKTWVDNNNQDGKRPESITVNLLADGEEIDSVTVTEADGWAWSFTDLPKFASGKRISYTVTEDEVEGYNAEVNGYSITNTHEPETTSVSGSKTWDDGDNYAGKRPDSIIINLLANGEVVQSKDVTEADGWDWEFKDLPKYANGVAIVYTITEDAVANYTTEIDGYNITNSYRNGKLIINKVISGKRAKADDEFTLKLTLKAANALQPAALNNSIFAAVLANVDGAENIVFTRYNSAGEIVASEYKAYYPSQVNEYEFKLKGGEKMIVTQLPDELLKYTVTETVKLGYIDTYSNCEGETYIFGDPVEATVKNHKGGSSNNIVPPPQFGPPKTGDASAIGYAMMSLMAALAAVTGRKR